MSKNTTSSDSAAAPKRRWLNIGPGLIIAIAISAFIGARHIETRTARQKPAAPPIVERQVLSSTHEEKSGPTPEVSFIIERAEKLRLSDPQLIRLKALQSRWQKSVAPKMAEAARLASKTSDYLADAKDNRSTPVRQIQEAAAPVVALSREISSARRGYWNEANRILRADQRKTLQLERQRAWGAKMKRLDAKTGAG